MFAFKKKYQICISGVRFNGKKVARVTSYGKEAQPLAAGPSSHWLPGLNERFMDSGLMFLVTDGIMIALAGSS